MADRGAVFAEEAYAQGKMLDHSGWGPCLPRNITPSDIDMVFDNGGSIIYCELSSSKSRWQELQSGQFRLYKSVISGTEHVAVLCQHDVKPQSGIKINTLTDIQNFHLMLCHKDSFFFTRSFPGKKWQGFVTRWHNDASFLRETLLNLAEAA